MTMTYWKLGGGDLSQDWTDAGLITDANDWSRVPSITGFRGDDLTPGVGIDPQTITGSSTNERINVIANQAAPNTLNTGGIAEFDGIPNRTVALQGSGTADAPYLVFYLDATGRQDVRVRYNLRDVDGSADNTNQQVALQYRISPTAPWTNLPAGYVADATSGPNLATQVTAVDVTLPADANNAATLEVRVITTNAPVNDEWVGVDDIIVSSASLAPGVPGALSIADAAFAEGDAGTASFAFTVNRIGGTSGAVEATYAVMLPGGANGADAGDFAAGTPLTGIVRFADGQAQATIVLPVTGDTAPEFDERFTVTLSGATGGASIDRATATGTILNDDLLPLTIGQIQGAGHTSAVAGQNVSTAGIVTALASNGFYLQDGGDGDDRTSDGIFVFTGSRPQDLFVGDGVIVEGRVAEFRAGTGGLTVTEIVNPVVTLDSTENLLPDAVRIGQGGRVPPTAVIDDDGLSSFDPATDGIDFYEALEGMRVVVDAPQVVAGTSRTVIRNSAGVETNTFVETWVVASGGEGATGLNARGGITSTPGDFNPERIQIQADRSFTAIFDADYQQGERLSDVGGILNYANASYEVLVTDPVNVTRDTAPVREVTDLAGTAGQLTLATYNVENLDPFDGKYATLARDIVSNLRSPDVIALQEIQDANGAGVDNGTGARPNTSLSGQATAQGLIDAIAAAGGGRYAYVEVAPSAPNSTGGEPNGNIRNGFLYNLDRVQYVAGSAELIDGQAYTGTRRPLVAQFDFNGERLTAINVHLTSRGGSDPLFGANQPPADAGDAARFNQAAGVKSYVAALLGRDPDAHVAILGDWNGFSNERAQTQLTDRSQGGLFTDLNTLIADPRERYSYQFEGNAQQLDHILVTDNLLPGARYDAVHLNAEFRGSRPTDHDPQLSLLRLGSPAQAAQADASDFRTASEPRQAVAGPDDALWAAFAPAGTEALAWTLPTWSDAIGWGAGDGLLSDSGLLLIA